MTAEDLAKGFAALDDDEVRVRVAAGDLTAAGELDLTDDEQELLLAAASDEAEVVGHGINAGLRNVGSLISKFDGAGGASVTVNKAKTADKAHQAMSDYLRG